MQIFIAAARADAGYALLDHLPSIIAAIGAIIGSVGSLLAWFQSKKNSVDLRTNTDKTSSIENKVDTVKEQTNGGLTDRIREVITESNLIPREELTKLINEAAAKAVTEAAIAATKKAVESGVALKVQT